LLPQAEELIVRVEGKPMAEQFNNDVFISHSIQDKPAMRALAERLRCASGLFALRLRIIRASLNRKSL
jgi:hypothetical protein